jgi:hypothetical protein
MDLQIGIKIVYGVAIKTGTLSFQMDEIDRLPRPVHMAFNGDVEDGVKVEWRGYIEDPDYVVAIAQEFDIRLVAEDLLKFDPSEFSVSPGWDEKLSSFCDKYDLTPYGQPNWYVVSTLRWS